jgi:hypothetical protein
MDRSELLERIFNIAVGPIKFWLYAAPIVVVLLLWGESILNNLKGFQLNQALAALVALVIVASVFIWLSYMGTKRTNPRWFSNPLGMPNGSVRAIIALLFVITLLLAAYPSSLDHSDPQKNNATNPASPNAPPQWLLGILGTIIGFYFGERASDNREKTEAEEDLPQRLEELEQSKNAGKINGQEYDDMRADLLHRWYKR